MYTKHTQQHKHRKEERQLSLVVASGYQNGKLAKTNVVNVEQKK